MTAIPDTAQGQGAAYTCPYCRIPSDGDTSTCPHCGAPVDVSLRVSDSGWEEQPPVRDMARIQFGRSSCQIEGLYVPVADVNLAEGAGVYFSHHVLLWSDPSVALTTMSMRGGWNRMQSGLPLVMMEAHGPGHVAFSYDHPGETIAIPLQQGQTVEAREHRFLTATTNVAYNWESAPVWYQTGTGDDVESHWPMGMYVDAFTATNGPGLLLLHSPGNVFIRDLAPGHGVLVQPSALVYKDPSVRCALHFEYPSGSWGFSGSWASRSLSTVWLRLSGPGRVAIQSVFETPEPASYVTGYSVATQHHW